MMPLVFELITILAVLGLGFVLGRIWKIRQQEIFGRKTKKRASRYRRRTFPPLGRGLPIGSRTPHRRQTYFKPLLRRSCKNVSHFSTGIERAACMTT